MDGPVENIQDPVSERKIAKALKARNHGDVILKKADDEYEQGHVFTARLQDRTPDSAIGWLSLSLAEEVCDPITTS